jgi:hypothetical protein
MRKYEKNIIELSIPQCVECYEKLPDSLYGAYCERCAHDKFDAKLSASVHYGGHEGGGKPIIKCL